MIFDLTHVISEGMPAYPGTEPPKLEKANTVEKDGFKETLISMYSHTGTHMDAPAHMLSGGRRLDEYPASQFYGRALVVDCRDVPKGGEIDVEHIKRSGAEEKAVDFLLFMTGQDRLWGEDSYYYNFPCLSFEAADCLKTLNLKGVGTDAISVDPVDTVDFPVHKRLMVSGMVFIENLKGLDRLPKEVFTFCSLPLKYIDADGAPARAIAIVE
ncbi:MAG TPA: cyclase family protein [Eubacteriales bacterium]|jgi:kynurenine formamidase|nr:cyclase family protein [Clostridia bacterium]HRV73148.1 cyclase family protein [Eubacteriales bacterium]